MIYGMPGERNPTGLPTESVSFYPDAVVLRVYGSSEDDLEKRGMVRINYMGFISDISDEEQTDEQAQVSMYQGQYEVDAWLRLPYGFKPTTEQSQATVKRVGDPMNQQYGFIAPPRRGDRVIAAYMGMEKWIVLGACPATGGNEQPPHTETDLAIIHRSGASMRFNDQYPSSMTGLPTGDYDGITGHMTLVGNRVMFLSGERWLPHGLMSDYEARSVNIDLNDEAESGHTYASKFDNSIEPATSDPYYVPWATSLGESKKFLKPPPITEGFAFIHQGSGMFKISMGGDNHSHMKMGARGVTIYAGKKYWNAGLMNENTHESPAEDSTVEDDVIKILHHSGAYIKINSVGGVSIVTADGQNYTITASDTGKIILGTEGVKVVGDGDSTSTHIVINAFGISTYEATTGHTHTVNASQDEVWIP